MGGGGAGWWGGEAYAQSETGDARHPLQALIDEAPAGGTVAVGPGIYGDAVLQINRPLTLTSETGQPGAAIFTGQSRIVVNSSQVTIAGLAFRDTSCMPGNGTAPALVEIRTDHPHAYVGLAATGIVVRNNAFVDTCQAAIQSVGSGGLTINVHGNVLENVGTDAPPGRAASGAIVLPQDVPNPRNVDGRITGNHIDGTGAAGILVYKSSVDMYDNYIANTPGSAIALAHGLRSSSSISGNTIVNASNGPGAPEPAAAVGVWADYTKVTVAKNTIRGSGGAFAVCAGSCADGEGGTGDAGDMAASSDVVFAGNTVYAHDGPNNAGGVLVRSNATGMLDATGNYFVGIEDRSDMDAIKDGSVNLGEELLPVSPDPVPEYDTYHVTSTIPADNSGIWNMAFDSVHNRLYLGTDPMEGSDHPNNSSIVYAYDMNGTAGPRLLGSWDVGGVGGRIADMEANPATGQVHVLHTWLDNATINTRADPPELCPPNKLGYNWYRGGNYNATLENGVWDCTNIVNFDGPTMGGWGLNVTTLNGSDMAKAYDARMSHHEWLGNRTTGAQQYNDYDLFPRNAALSAELEVAADRGLLFASTVLHSPIAVLNNSADEPAFEVMGEPGRYGEHGFGRATYVSAMAVNASGPVTTAYAADGWYDWLFLSAIKFTGLESYERIGYLNVSSRSDSYRGSVREIVLDDAADRLFVLWYDTQKVSMYALDANTVWDNAVGASVGIPVFVKDLEGTDSPLADYGARDMSLDGDAGILYTVVRDYTDPRVVAHNTTTGALLGTSSLGNEPVSVEVGRNGTVYAAPQQWPNVYVIEPQPASELQRMIDAAPPAGGAHYVAGTIGASAGGSGASHLAVDAGRGVAYLGTLGSPPAVQAYNTSSGAMLGSHTVAGRDARIIDMEANPETGQVHVLHTWLDNDTINTRGDPPGQCPPSGYGWNWYRGGQYSDSVVNGVWNCTNVVNTGGPTLGGWGLNVTTLDGAGMTVDYAARLEHQDWRGNTTSGIQTNEYDLFPLLAALSAGLEVDAGRGLLFASTVVHSPIAVLDNSAPEEGFKSMGEPNQWGGTGTGYGNATHVTAVAVRASRRRGHGVRGRGGHGILHHVANTSPVQLDARRRARGGELREAGRDAGRRRQLRPVHRRRPRDCPRRGGEPPVRHVAQQRHRLDVQARCQGPNGHGRRRRGRPSGLCKEPGGRGRAP